MKGQRASVRRSEAQFNRWAPHYDSSIWSLYFARGYRRAAAIVQTTTPDRPTILDLGSGTGGLASLLSARISHARVVAFDLSSKMAEQCARRRAHSVDVIVGEADRLPFQDDSFNAIACLNSFHHYPDAHIVLTEVARCLVPGGTFLMLDPTRDGPVRRLWAAILRRLFGEDYATYYTTEETTAMLRRAGLDPTQGERLLYFTRFTIANKPTRSLDATATPPR